MSCRARGHEGRRQLEGCIEQDLTSQAQPVVDALSKAGLSVVTAESCTGGLIAAILSHAQNASACLHGGFVVYTKTHKHAALGVDENLLGTQGSVNAEVARQMAEGALRHSPASIALAVTGVLGPNPDEDDNPPGLIYLGLALSGRPTRIIRHDFGRIDPDEMRRQVILNALNLLLETVHGT